MATRRSLRTQSPASTSESEEDEQQSSQDNTVDMMDVAKDIVTKNNERREKKRKALEAEHDKRVKDIKSRIDALFAARNSRVCKAHQEAWARLDALDKKRQNIEGLILATMKEIEAKTIQLSAELAAMFEGRLEEMEGRQSQDV
ncbi:hypothetical protein BKA65DRAFT_489867 [Rhexocercosporidium sp. MPI-PUGE-AT-0058]|nr:hypothetical protein BKA65DRAFT_489867 [Rhexocercosporidium sp. MPI-PUGE-AT-0058]